MLTTGRRLLLLVALLFAAVNAVAGETSFTDLMSPAKYTECGLNKLTADEIRALNAWMMDTYVALNMQRSSSSSNLYVPSVNSALRSSQKDATLFDSAGEPRAYIEDDYDQTIYLWSGTPAAYIYGDSSIYGFNGKHLGWYKDGLVYDNDGHVCGGPRDAFRGPLSYEGAKGLKDLKPLKSLRELKPLRPPFTNSWSRTSLTALLLKGVPD